jgi:hypothetical protein
MNATAFVEKIRKLTPSPEYFAQYNIPADEIESLQKMFLAQRLRSSNKTENALLDLVDDFDASTLEIGLIRFEVIPAHLRATDKFWRVGFVESDWLVIDRKTLQIKVEAHDAENYEVAICAENAERFLDAVYQAAGYICSPNRTAKKNCQQARICWKLAGDNSLDFYKMLLLCYE